jgi:hypothetical protein
VRCGQLALNDLRGMNLFSTNENITQNSCYACVVTDACMSNARRNLLIEVAE